MLYQQAFRQAAPNRMAEYRKYHWSVAVPKRPFPISDQMPSEVEDGNQKILALPLAPQLLLLGHTEEGNPEGTDLIQRIALARTDEEKLKALICGSGILEVVANQNDMDIPILHTRTNDNHWPKISRPDWMVEAGPEEAKDIMLTMIDESLYNSLLRTLARNEGEPDPGNAFETMHDVKAPVQAREKPGKTTEETERG
jgi:hypothetical protein